MLPLYIQVKLAHIRCQYSGFVSIESRAIFWPFRPFGNFFAVDRTQFSLDAPKWEPFLMGNTKKVAQAERGGRKW
jgi:hypothetical protein